LRGLSDPVVSGIVPRLNQPGGNITGFGLLEPSLGGKWLELLSEIAPGLKRAAIMLSPDNPGALVYVPPLETGARSLKVELITAPVHSDAEIKTAIKGLGREPGGGLIVTAEVFTNTVYVQSFYARDGGLLSYGPAPTNKIKYL
jgi:putative ABC transport system substrate-binding protein